MEVDRAVDAQPVAGGEGRLAVALPQHHRPADDHERLRLLEDADPRRAHQVEERPGTPVEDGHLGAVHLDANVVDAEAAQRGEHVLDRPHPRLALGQRGRQRGVHHVGGGGRDARGAGEVHPVEDDPVAGGRRAQRQRHLSAGVETHATGRDWLLEGSLME
jgi:hypothetical protein